MKAVKAYSFARYGGPEVLIPVEIPMPEVLPGEVLIRVAATGVNPSDVKNLSGHFGTSLPRIPGRDYAGTIVAGAGREGEAVWGSGPGFGVDRDGAFVEYLRLPSSWVAKKPSSLSMEAAAAVGVPYLTAWSALVVAGRLAPEETVLVVGAAGAVGRAAIEIARWRRARVIAASRSASVLAGTDGLVAAGDPDWPRRVLALTGGRGVDLALDTIGGPFFEPCLNTLRSGGRQVAIASNPADVSFNLVDFYHGAKRLIGVDSMALRGEEIAGMMEELRHGFEEGRLTAPSVSIWPFASAREALSAVREEPGKKQVLVFDLPRSENAPRR
jgi:NADPH:quinone reductase-like Zn-dependent oxidoreductase